MTLALIKELVLVALVEALVIQALVWALASVALIKAPVIIALVEALVMLALTKELVLVALVGALVDDAYLQYNVWWGQTQLDIQNYSTDTCVGLKRDWYAGASHTAVDNTPVNTT